MPTTMDRSELERARETSTKLFGAKHRLPVAIAIHRGPADGIFAAAIAREVHASETQVGNELKRLAEADLLADGKSVQRSVPGGRPIQSYRRKSSAYWRLAAELAKQRLSRPGHGR
jgi:hypothetical protein